MTCSTNIAVNSKLYEALPQPWQHLVDLAWESYKAGSLPIAALITDGEGDILSTGRNRIFEETSEMPYLSNTKLAHAEVNALLALGSEDAKRSDLKLYTTLEPCPLCMGASRMMGIPEIHYAARDPWAGCAAMAQQVPYLQQAEMKMVPPFSVELEQILIAWLYERFSYIPKVLRKFEATYPEASAAGKILFESGQLKVVVRRGGQAKEVLDYIHKAINQVQLDNVS